MSQSKLTRREFMQDTAAGAAAMAVAAAAPDLIAPGNPTKQETGKVLNYNPDMEYRRCGKTNLMISAVSLGGHWKRVVKVIGGQESAGWMTMEIDNPAFQKNRYDVVTRCIERGINYVDACCGEEIMAYARALKGRRDKMYFGFSWHVRESRFPEWRSRQKLQEGLDLGMKEAGLEYVDLWRISLLVDSHEHSWAEVEEAIAALDWAKKTGRSRFTGISAHDRTHIRQMIEKYPQQLEVILTPYSTRSATVVDEAGLWAAIKKGNVGWFGIKPFASNSVFKGDSSPQSPFAEQDSRTARLRLRAILNNPSITAPIPGLISVAQVDNAVQAVKEPRKLDAAEKAELDQTMRRAMANLPPNYHWLRDWEYA